MEAAKKRKGCGIAAGSAGKRRSVIKAQSWCFVKGFGQSQEEIEMNSVCTEQKTQTKALIENMHIHSCVNNRLWGGGGSNIFRRS